MAKREVIEGYSVIVFVPVRENQPTAAYCLGGSSDAGVAREIAQDIADGIQRHVGCTHRAAVRPEIEPQVSIECEHCGYRWHGSPYDPEYNGGCCAGDEEEHKERVADNAQFGVGA